MTDSKTMINNFTLIIGAMKCGTTSIFNYLAQHPEIVGCKYKEPHFFSKAQNFAKGYDYYQSLWDWDKNTHKIATEATPGYTKVTHEDPANAAANIFQMQQELGSNFKFIYIMRDPLERIESHYLHDALKSQKTNHRNVASIDQSVIDTSKYAMQLDEYYRRFSADQILLLDFAQFTTNPSSTLKQICKFLDIDSSFEFIGTQKAHNSRERLRIKFPLLNKGLRRTSLVKYLRSAISDEQKSTLKKLFGTRDKVSFQLSELLKKELAQELKPDLLKLSKSYNFDISSWQIKL